MTKHLFVGCLIAILPALAADPPKKTEPRAYTDPEKAGPDFKIQGEYTGEFPRSGKFGLQVIAEGDGEFAARFLPGGLPGDGWNGKDRRFPATVENGKMTFGADAGLGNGEIGDGTITLPRVGNMTFKRTTRHSPTEGAKPPAGAIVLFDGKSADEWDHGKIEKGLLSVNVPGGQTSKRKFGDFTGHVEFILPFMPKARGQARGNSGVFVNGRYEIQVLDSFGLEGKNNECGGVYSLLAPKVNMCYPPLQWQSYDIDFTAPRFGADGKKTADARLTLKHNGVVVHDNFDLKNMTPGNILPDNAEPGPIQLQNHGGDPVFYRNIWVLEKK